MPSRITREVLEALPHCRLKAYFRLRGEEGIRSSYEQLQIDLRDQCYLKAITKIRREYGTADLADDLHLSVTMPSWKTTVTRSGSTDCGASKARQSSATFTMNRSRSARRGAFVLPTANSSRCWRLSWRQSRVHLPAEPPSIWGLVARDSQSVLGPLSEPRKTFYAQPRAFNVARPCRPSG
jgi:hypothetical protein